VSANTIIGLSSLIFVSVVLMTLFAKKLIQKSLLVQVIILIMTFLIYTAVINYPNNILSTQLLIGAVITTITSYLFYLIIRSMGNEHKYL
jgi:hypothetical protein